jgi:KEOPS complex subunit Cgi121
VEFEMRGRVVAVLGGKLRARSDEVIRRAADVQSKHGVIAQVFDARRVAGKEHLLHAVSLALLFEERGERFADNPALNLLCWAAAERQIEVALRKVGVTPATEEVAVVVVGKDRTSVGSAVEEVSGLMVRDDGILLQRGKERELRETFSLPSTATAEEMGKFVLEKIALLELLK